MKWSILLTILAVASSGSAAGLKSYEGYKLLRITAQNQKHLDVLLELRDAWENTEPHPSALVNFWSEPAINFPTDLMVTPDAITKVQDILEGNSIPYSVQMENVETLVQNQLAMNQAALATAPGDERIGWTAYNRYDAVMEWLDELAANYSTVATVESIGQSTEGRELKLIKVATPGGVPNKKAIFIDGTFHAREWISPAVVTYIINQLVTNSSAYAHILDNIDFYLLPLVNPDGYEFTHTSQRLWRKTRSVINGSTCLGVDPNRNFDIDFGGSGSSTSPCAETYLGTAPFNIPETRLLSQYIRLNANKFKAYLSMHSYSQAWLTPYAWSASPPPFFSDIMSVGTKAIESLQAVYGTRYVVGPTSTTLYFHSGASQDWTKDVTSIKYTYTVELRDTGDFGFLLPPNQILPTSVETWAAIQTVAREIMTEI
jgi:murein tripeptide amidase MpaA